MTDTTDTSAGGAAAFSADLLTGDAGTAPPVAAAAPGDAGAGDGAPAGDPWFAALPDDAPDDKTLSDRKWAENKGYADVPTMVKAMRSLESQFGGEKLPLPKGPDDKDGWDRLFKAAGRPDAPDDYKFDGIANIDPALTGAFAPVAHQLGLSQAQAEGVAKFNEAMVAEQANATKTAHAAEVAAMRKEVGSDGFNAMLERGLRAAERFGLEPADVAALRQTVGPKKLVSLLDSIGKAMGEDTLEGGGKQAFDLTPDKVATRKAEIKGDRAFQDRLRAKDPAAVAEWAAINDAEAKAMERARAA